MIYKNVCSLVVVLLLASCGGGGGGGAPAPANLQPTGPGVGTPDPQQVAEGVFTDAPVTGLRFVQGTYQSGVTVDGKFQYNQRSSDPICFYIEQIQLGCAKPGELITPYDLAMPGMAPGLQSGFNISRLLISLDQDAAPGIRLPGDLTGTQGSIDWAVREGVFEADPLVVDLINRYALNGLATPAQVNAHLQNNADVTAVINDMKQVLNQSIDRVNIAWDSTLTSEGILAHLEAGNGPSMQHLYLLLDEIDQQLYLRRIIHISPSKKAITILLDKTGTPVALQDDGVVKEYLRMKTPDWDSFIYTERYRPQQTAVLIGAAGMAAADTVGYFGEERSQEITSIINGLAQGSLSQEQVLILFMHASALVSNLQCGGSATSPCITQLQDALLLVLHDPGYQQSLLAWESKALQFDFCTYAPAQKVCQMAPTLTNFNVIMDQDFSNQSRLKTRPRLSKPRQTILGEFNEYEYIVFYLAEKVDDYVLQYGFMCHTTQTVTDLGDGTFYGAMNIDLSTCGNPNVMFELSTWCSKTGSRDPVACDVSYYESRTNWAYKKQQLVQLSKILQDGLSSHFKYLGMGSLGMNVFADSRWNIGSIYRPQQTITRTGLEFDIEATKSEWDWLENIEAPYPLLFSFMMIEDPLTGAVGILPEISGVFHLPDHSQVFMGITPFYYP